ncbi:MAG: ImmA/IrrE family metallo-endopeptidase [Acidobacteria bacterium]|nr:ImmA/IrrE family metallo-endopeptidase [Acidobacteriota bacterium]
MPRATKVPITKDVLRWAIDESGIPLANLADKVQVSQDELQQWIEGTGVPTLSKFRRLASLLHRPTALFLLPAPPAVQRPHVQFRRPTGGQVRRPNPAELRALRQAARMQRVLAWVTHELAIGVKNLPKIQLSTRPEDAAERARIWCNISRIGKLVEGTSSQAFDAWRDMVESKGILVYLASLGGQSCKGFSLWDQNAPIVCVNTHWREEARIFTLLHELGHLLTRTNSACVDGERLPRTGGDLEERWCEEFAAAVLLPQTEVFEFLRNLMDWQPGRSITSLEDARLLARKFNASLRAAVLRLIELDVSSWDLYEQIPATSDNKTPAVGGHGRTRRQICEDQYGRRVAQLFHAAVQHELISRNQAVDYLDIPDVEFDHLDIGSGQTGT